MTPTRFVQELLCLDLGILGPSVTESKDDNSIDEALKLLGPEAARRAARKFRKLARKTTSPKKWWLLSRREKRNRVRREIYVRCIMLADHLAVPDNDV